MDIEPVLHNALDEVEECGNIVSIAIQAIAGTPNPKTMRIVDDIKKKKVVILIDTGGAHNFVYTVVVA